MRVVNAANPPRTLPQLSRQFLVRTGGAAIAAHGNNLRAVLPVSVPAGQRLTLARVASDLQTTALVRGLTFDIFVSPGGDYTGANFGEDTPGTVLYDNSAGTADVMVQVFVQINNPTSGSLTPVSSDTIWCHLLIS